jgi:3-oxoacyl-[acyl-carrier-protein] synthase III
MQKPIFVSHIEYSLGDKKPIAELDTLAANASARKFLANQGMRDYSKIASPLYGVLVDTTRRTLDSAGIKGSEVDAVIYFSTMFDLYSEHSDLANLSHKLELTNAVPYGVFINQCTNFTQAIQIAGNLIRAEGMGKILLIGGDKHDGSKSDRVMPNNTSVYSDVAVSFLIEGEDNGGFLIRGMKHKYVPEMAKIAIGSDITAFIQRYSEGMSGVCGELYAETGVNPEDIHHLVAANYNLSVLKNIAYLARIPDKKLFKENIADMAHCFSADHLISLKTMADKGLLEKGQLLNLVAVGGFWIFSATLLQKV